MITKQQLEQAIIDSNEWLQANEGVNLLYYLDKECIESYKIIKDILNKNNPEDNIID